MKLKNNALQELYDALVKGTIPITPSVESPVDKAFRECDEKLSDSIAFVHVKDLQDRNDILERSNKTLLEANMEAISKMRNLENALDDAKNQLNYFTYSRDDWRSRAKYAEKEVEDLKATIEKVNTDRTELQKSRDSYHDLYTELSKTYDKLSKENRGLKARTDCLRLEVNWYRKHYKEQSDKIQELKSRLNSIHGVSYDKYIKSRYIGYEQGQKDLWDKLREVADATSSELLGCFTNVCEIEDLIEWNLEDFVNEYNEWQGRKRKKEAWGCTLEGTINNVKINKDLLMKVCGIGSFADFDPEIRQKECFNEMYADMTVVDYPKRFRNKKGDMYYRSNKYISFT